MNSRIRKAVFTGALLLAGVARAASTSSAVPANEEKTLEAAQPSVPYLDYANCPTPKAQQDVQIKAVLQYPDEDRGAVVEKGGCAVASTEAAPTTVDDRYRLGE
jgi:hypothetical protein